MAHLNDKLGAVDLRGDPRQALTRLIESSWQIIHRFRALLQAAQRSRAPERIRTAHDRPMRRLLSLIKRGQKQGAFRADLPAVWLVATFYTVIHGAADEIAAGRLADDDAARFITGALLAAYTPPGHPVPATPIV